MTDNGDYSKFAYLTNTKVSLGNSAKIYGIINQQGEETKTKMYCFDRWKQLLLQVERFRPQKFTGF